MLLSNYPTDWTKYTSIIFKEEVKIERVTPDTSADPLYVYTFPFTVDFWLSLPVKLYNANLIYEIHVPIGEIEQNFNFESMQDIAEVMIKANNNDTMDIDRLSWKTNT